MTAVDPSRCVAVVLAGGRAARLHELGAIEAKPALPVGPGRRLVDFALHAVAAAGIPRAVLALGHRPEALRAHVPGRWGDALRLTLRDAGTAGTAAALAACAPDLGDADAVVVLEGSRLGFVDLRAMLAGHEGGATTAAGGGAWALDARALGDAHGLGAAPDLDAWASGRARPWDHPGPWRAIGTLDDLREGALDLARGLLPGPLPPPAGPVPVGGREIVVEAGGLSLSAPRFGARRPGRWTVLDDTVVMAGARVGPGARLSRTLVAPGAVVPASLCVGDEPAEDARFFRVTPGGTTLITAPMLAARAVQLMRDRAPRARHGH